MVKLPHWPHSNERAKIEPGLKTTANLLEAIGSPHMKLPPVIHVAGTNGKGSTIAFMRAIFEDAGYRVHSYTSPHLLRYNERINLAGKEISDGFLYEVIEETRVAAEENKIRPTFFEGTTAAAFLAFSKVDADVLLLETGLGGRLDSTNVLESPLLSVITTISIDHTDFLGNTIEQIASEKAGIIKKNTPCIVSQQYIEALKVIANRASELEVDIEAFEYSWGVEKKNQGFIYKSDNKEIEITKLGLIGDHQIVNAGNAITAAINAKNYKISDNNIINGIANAFWPARLQKLINGKLLSLIPKNWEIIVDGAHNNAAAHILSVWLKENNNLPTYLIFGMTKGRDIKSFVSFFKSEVKHIMAVDIKAEPLSYLASDICNAINKLDIPNSECESIEDAISKIITMESGAARILVCGSLFLAADVCYINQGSRN